MKKIFWILFWLLPFGARAVTAPADSQEAPVSHGKTVSPGYQQSDAAFSEADPAQNINSAGPYQNRASYVGAQESFGSNAYRFTLIDGLIGVSETVAIVLSSQFESSNLTPSARRFRLGVDQNVSKFFGYRLGGLFGKEPNNVSVAGAEATLRFVLSELVGWKKRTEFDIGFRFLRYRETVLAGKKKRFTSNSLSIPENSFTASLSQEIFSALSGYVSYSDYTMLGSDPDQLSVAISNRPNLSAGMLNLVSGFTKRSLTLGGDVFTGNFVISPSVYKNQFSGGGESKGGALTFTYLTDFGLDLEIGGSRSTSNSGTVSGALQFGATYNWD